jgi:hypothetical protein
MDSPQSKQRKHSGSYEQQECHNADDQHSHSTALLSWLGKGDTHKRDEHPEQIAARIWRWLLNWHRIPGLR